MKGNSKTTFIMVMEDTFIQMVTTIQECGKMENDQDGESQLTRVVRYTKACGNTVNSLAIDEHRLLLIQQTQDA